MVPAPRRSDMRCAPAIVSRLILGDRGGSKPRQVGPVAFSSGEPVAYATGSPTIGQEVWHCHGQHPPLVLRLLHPRAVRGGPIAAYAAGRALGQEHCLQGANAEALTGKRE